MEDCEIVELYWSRAESAIDETDRKYGRMCGAIAFNILHNREDSDECVSDTYLKAWYAMPDERPALLGSFLGKITRNLSLNRWRAVHAKKRGGGEPEALLDELAECVPAAGGTAETADGLETARLIDAFLLGLDRQSRVFFVRRYFYADSIGYIASRFDASESKVKSSLMRTRNKLRAYLANEGVVV